MKWKFIETSVYTLSHLDCICHLYAKPMEIIIITGLFGWERDRESQGGTAATMSQAVYAGDNC